MKSAAVFILCGIAAARAAEVPAPARAVPVTDVLHGASIVDPYRWLEDGNSPETRAWIEAQSRFTQAYLDKLPQRETLRKRLLAVMQDERMSAPAVRGGRYFFTRRRAGESRTSILAREGIDGRERVLVNPATLSPDERVTVQFVGASHDGSMIAYGIRNGGEDEMEIHFLDVASGRPKPDILPRARYSGLSMKPDSSGFYYSRFLPKQGSRAWYHAIGTAASDDREIFGAGYGPDDFVGVSISDDGRWLLYTVFSGVPTRRSEIYVQDLKAGTPRRLVLKEEETWRPYVRGDRLYLWTKAKAPNWRVLVAPLEDPEPGRWKEVIPEGKLPMESFSAAAGRLFAQYLDNVNSRVREFDGEGRYLRDLPLPGIGSATAPAGRWDDREVFYDFESFNRPPTIYRYQPAKGTQDTWFAARVGLDISNLTVEQVWYPSKDGTRIPMFIVRKKDVPFDGKRPTLLTGYGGFALSEKPGLSPTALAWAAGGGIFAEPNLRGGGEFGEAWHKAGMFEKKQNVFDDFYAAAEWLIAHHYTDAAHLAIRGGSNGGLLVGAALTQRPELFKAAVCGAPLLDMLRYHKFKVGSWWAAEYGSADDATQFEYLRKYSPYHNVRKGVKYPAVMFSTGDADTRVDPMHARKMAALLQAATGSENSVLLRYDTAGGHTSGVSVARTAEQVGDELGFLAAQVGLE